MAPMTDAHQAARAKLLDGAPVLSHAGTNHAAFLEPDIAAQRQRCKCCGAALVGSVPARDEKSPLVRMADRALDDHLAGQTMTMSAFLADDASTPARPEYVDPNYLPGATITGDEPPQTWRDRDKLT